MPFDANGNYSLPPVYRAIPGTTIQTQQHNTPMEDIQAALNRVLLRDGSAPASADIKLGQYGIRSDGSSTLANLTVTTSLTAPKVTNWTAYQAVGAKDAEDRYLRQGGQYTTGAYTADQWTANSLSGGGAFYSGGLIRSTIGPRGITNDIYSFENTGSDNGLRIALYDLTGRRSEFSFFMVSGLIAGPRGYFALQSTVDSKMPITGGTFTGGVTISNNTALTFQNSYNQGSGLVSSSGWEIQAVNRNGSFVGLLREDIGTQFYGVLRVQNPDGWVEYQFTPKDGRVQMPAGTSAVTSDLPIAPGQRIQSFIVQSAANAEFVSFPVPFSGTPSSVLVCDCQNEDSVTAHKARGWTSSGFTLMNSNGAARTVSVIAIGPK